MNDAPNGAATEASLLSVERAEIGYLVNGEPRWRWATRRSTSRPGEKIMLLGPSGCGKSTLLKAVAGFIEPVAGTIAWRAATPRPGPDRAVVFQEFDQLFPWRTVLGQRRLPAAGDGREPRKRRAERAEASSS